LLPSFQPTAYDLDFFYFSASPSSSSSSSCFCLYIAKVFTYPDFFYVALLMSSILPFVSFILTKPKELRVVK
jgi:hypothetical protein